MQKYERTRVKGEKKGKEEGKKKKKVWGFAYPCEDPQEP
jgi:hypothetical protein